MLLEIFQFFGSLATLGAESFGFIVRGAVSYKHTVRQMAEVGVGSLMVAIVTVGFSGAVAALYLSIQLVKYGQPNLVGGVIGKSLALEIAPVITAIVVAARSGSAMAAELGSMTVTEQVDALRSLATSPVQYLVVPRVLGTLIMLPLITVIANAAGLVGGYLASTSNGVTATQFMASFQDYTYITDQTNGLLKTIPFALGDFAHWLPSGIGDHGRCPGRGPRDNIRCRFCHDSNLRHGFFLVHHAARRDYTVDRIGFWVLDTCCWILPRFQYPATSIQHRASSL